MKFVITGKNIEVTKALKDIIEEKIGKLERYFSSDTEARVSLSVQKDHHKVEVTIPVKGSVIRAEQESSDMYAAIDLVEEIIERQLKKYKNKIIESKQDIESFAKSYVESEEIEDEEIEITRVKKFAIKPMTPEDACVQMELLGHSFFVFRNMETDEVNVVYKRKGKFNSYGLIDPSNTIDE